MPIQILHPNAEKPTVPPYGFVAQGRVDEFKPTKIRGVLIERKNGRTYVGRPCPPLGDIWGVCFEDLHPGEYTLLIYCCECVAESSNSVDITVSAVYGPNIGYPLNGDHVSTSYYSWGSSSGPSVQGSMTCANLHNFNGQTTQQPDPITGMWRINFTIPEVPLHNNFSVTVNDNTGGTTHNDIVVG
jgi:hypothetical protein